MAISIQKSYFSVFLSVLVFFFLFFFCKENNPAPKKLQVDVLEAAFEQYKERALTHRRFKHADIVPLIEKRNKIFTREELGKSVQGREIFQLSYGRGSTRILLWSQMHGNESTATMALFDLFNFLEGKGDGFDSIRNALMNRLDIRFIPMVNPDGAEHFQRRNALGIDLNRDAIQETSPEAKLLKAAREKIKPAFGFNLHDQQIYYNVTGTPQPATISVLAPAYNSETEVNEVRTKAMKVIVGMNELLQQVIPGQVGKYDDAFEPRAFGDNFQKLGTSTILIESGGYPGDAEKQYIRQLNFMVILNALYEIATESYDLYILEDYYAIPDNDSKLMDVILRSLSIEMEGQKYQVDLGIKRVEVNYDSSYFAYGTIADVGDLSVYFGYQDIDAEGLEYKAGNMWKGTFQSLADISEKKAFELLKQGYLAVKVAEATSKHYTLPLLVLQDVDDFKSGYKIDQVANFFLQQPNGKLVYAIVNGYLIDLNNPQSVDWRQRVHSNSYR
jgi:hypothetical protein